MSYPLSISPPTTTEDEAAPYMVANAVITRELIRERLLKLTGIPSAVRAVLIEVCTLHEVGSKRRCFITNEALAERACCHFKSVSRHIQTLEREGLLACHYTSANKASREIKPSEVILSICHGADPTSLAARLKDVRWRSERDQGRVAGGGGAGGSEGWSGGLRGMERGAPQIEYKKEETSSEVYPSRAEVAASAADTPSPQVVELEKKLAEAEYALTVSLQVSQCNTLPELVGCWKKLAEKPTDNSPLKAIFSARRHAIKAAEEQEKVIAGLKEQVLKRPKTGKGKKSGQSCDDLVDTEVDTKKQPELNFEAFWKLYLPFRGDGKFEAKKIWIALSADLRQKVLDGLPNFISRKTATSGGKHYHPHATTFLNSNPWNDECFAEAPSEASLLPTMPTPTDKLPASGQEAPGQALAFRGERDQSMNRILLANYQKRWPKAIIHLIQPS